jgi:hypothetical protein
MLFLNIIILSSLLAGSQAFFLSPSVYNPPAANKHICQLYTTDEANNPKSTIHKPYFHCTDDAHLKIERANLITTTPNSCPLQYTYPNPVQTCAGKLINDDVTAILKNLCDTKTECIFQWEAFGQLKCNDLGHYNNDYTQTSGQYNNQYAYDKDNIWIVDNNNQALNVTYVCEAKRNQCKRSCFLSIENKLDDYFSTI